MIAYLSGDVLLVEEQRLVLQTSGGVGYLVQVPRVLGNAYSVGDALNLHIHTSVREDEISLYGFETTAERQLFERLLKASGIGPKLALTTVSVLEPRNLVQAILREDVNTLSQVPGIGKKTAARLCLELKDNFSKSPIQGLESALATSKATTTTAPSGETASLQSALKNMGFAEKEILNVLASLPPEAEGFEVKLRLTLGLLSKR
jgi:Holliday junction DNA helicase RuvA